MQVEIICTGDEVLTGKIINTNYAYLSNRLEECGFEVLRGVTVGDEREALLRAFREAGGRAAAVVVNGGLGPTVDDLSQEVAAEASGSPLELHQGWLARMEEFFANRSRKMPPNNTKQAMLPKGAELLDNPIGTACGFAVQIGGARFFFTPGVPRELHRMLEEQVLPRLLAQAGTREIVRLRRFHSYGLGESHVDSLLRDEPALSAANGVKLGFRAHYPQLETKLTIRAADEAEFAARLAPAEAVVRRQLGNFLLAQDDELLEGVVLRQLAAQGERVSILEGLTGGRIAARLIAPLQGRERVRFCAAAPDLAGWSSWLELPPPEHSPQALAAYTAQAAQALTQRSGASIGLACWVEAPQDETHGQVASRIYLALARRGAVQQRYTQLAGGRGWVLSGATEMGLDSLRRFLAGLPVDEATDFEKR